jgi:hypothetical protein
VPAERLVRMAYNGRMHVYELLEALGDIPEVEIGVRRGALNVHVPALGDTARLDPGDILSAEDVYVPTGAPAVQLDIKIGREVLPLIVTTADLVFTPAYADNVISRDAELRVPAMPALIAYSEMHRDVRAFGRTIDDPEAIVDRDMVAATLLAHRCYLNGALRVGLWPVRVAAWWEYANARIGSAAGVASFRPDLAWDDLMADVAEARRQTADTLSPAAEA